MYDLGVSYTFHFHKKNTESSVIFLRNDVLILNGKENKEATAICFEIRIPKKKNKELLRKVPSKIYEVILLWKKTKKKFGLLIFPNIITKQWGYSQINPNNHLSRGCRGHILADQLALYQPKGADLAHQITLAPHYANSHNVRTRCRYINLPNLATKIVFTF